MTKSLITTHVLDTAKGVPAAGIPITLYRQQGADWQRLDSAITDADGRIMQWRIADSELDFGHYKLTFELTSYLGEQAFYPCAEVVFCRRDDRHHHIPLLLSPFGYSTYRGS